MLSGRGREEYQLLVRDGKVLWTCVSIVIYLEGLLIQALKLMTSIVLLYVSNLYLGFRRHGLISVYASCQAHGIWFGRFIDPLFPKSQEGSEGCYNEEGTDICAYEVNAMRRGSDCLITRCPLWWTHACACLWEETNVLTTGLQDVHCSHTTFNSERQKLNRR